MDQIKPLSTRAGHTTSGGPSPSASLDKAIEEQNDRLIQSMVKWLVENIDEEDLPIFKAKSFAEIFFQNGISSIKRLAKTLEKYPEYLVDVCHIDDIDASVVFDAIKQSPAITNASNQSTQKAAQAGSPATNPTRGTAQHAAPTKASSPPVKSVAANVAAGATTAAAGVGAETVAAAHMGGNNNSTSVSKSKPRTAAAPSNSGNPPADLVSRALDNLRQSAAMQPMPRSQHNHQQRPDDTMTETNSYRVNPSAAGSQADNDNDNDNDLVDNDLADYRGQDSDTGSGSHSKTHHTNSHHNHDHHLQEQELRGGTVTSAASASAASVSAAGDSDGVMGLDNENDLDNDNENDNDNDNDIDASASEAGTTNRAESAYDAVTVENEVEEIETSSVANTFADMKLDRFGFYIGEDDMFHSALEISPAEARTRMVKETQREKKWVQMLESWTNYAAYRGGKLKNRIRKGIPNALRGTVWYKLIRADSYRLKYPNFCNAGKWAQLDERTMDEIERDIDRTFPKHVHFLHKDSPGQLSLRRLLRWYAVLDPQVGYCQGMGFIAGLLLTYMPEERAFYSLVGILQNPESPLRELYLPGMVDAKKKLFVFEGLGRLHLGALWTNLEEQGMHPSMYATEWLMTMFCRGFSFDLVSRVFDVFTNEGYKIVYRVCLALLKNVEAILISAPFEEIMSILRRMPILVDAPKVMDIAWQIPLRRKEIAVLEEQFLSQPKR